MWNAPALFAVSLRSGVFGTIHYSVVNSSKHFNVGKGRRRLLGRHCYTIPNKFGGAGASYYRLRQRTVAFHRNIRKICAKINL